MYMYGNLKIVLVMSLLLGNAAFAAGQLPSILEGMAERKDSFSPPGSEPDFSHRESDKSEDGKSGASAAAAVAPIAASAAAAAAYPGTALCSGHHHVLPVSARTAASPVVSLPTHRSHFGELSGRPSLVAAAFGGGYGVAAPAPAAPAVGYGASAAAAAAADPLPAPVRGVGISREAIVGTDLSSLVRGITRRADGTLENVPDPRIAEREWPTAERIQEYFILGVAHTEGRAGGWNVDQNYENAFLWFRKASTRHTEALFYLGVALLEEKGVRARDVKRINAEGKEVVLEQRSRGADRTDACRAFEMAAEQGHVGAQVRLAKMYIEGCGTAKDVTGGLRLLTSFAEKESPRSFELLEHFAREGNADIRRIASLLAYNLGVRCFNGDAGSRDYSKAIDWLRVAQQPYGLDTEEVRVKIRGAQMDYHFRGIVAEKIALLPLA